MSDPNDNEVISTPDNDASVTIPGLRILVAVDEDEASRVALRFTERLAGWAEDVTVLNVAGTLMPFLSDPMGGYVILPPDPISIDRIDAEAERVVEVASDELSTSVSADPLVEYGDPGERICAVARERDVDLVIVGSHDKGAFARFLHGSVSDYVLRHSPCPVLVVRHHPDAD